MIGHNQFIVETSTSASATDVIAHLAMFKNLPLLYFRDISTSTRKLFKKEK